MIKRCRLFLCVSMMGMLVLFAGCGKKSEEDVTNKEVYGELSPLSEDELEAMDASDDEDLTEIDEPDDSTDLSVTTLDDSAQEKQEE